MKQINSQEELPDGEVIGTGNDARVALLDSIGDRNDVVRADELADVNDDDTVSQFIAPELTDEEQGEKEAELQADEDGTVAKELQRAADEANSEEPVEEEKTKIIVGGKELYLTKAELITRAQKVEAADVYLAEAARIRKEAERDEPSQDAPTEEDDRALVRAIQMGTEDEALTAIRKLKAGPSFTKDDVTKTVDERLNFNQAANHFKEQYKDLMEDPVLRQMVVNRDQELLNAGDKREFLERWSDIGNNVRSWRDGLVKANSKDPLDDKRARKAQAANPIKTADVKAAKTEEDDKEPTPSEIISQIAKARGGPQWMRS